MTEQFNFDGARKAIAPYLDQGRHPLDKPAHEFHTDANGFALMLSTLIGMGEEAQRLKMQHFFPVNEDAEPGTPECRKNFLKIVMNFDALQLQLRVIDTGAAPGDGTGDTVRVAWEKVNVNFAQLDKIVYEIQRDAAAR